MKRFAILSVCVASICFGRVVHAQATATARRMMGLSGFVGSTSSSSSVAGTNSAAMTFALDVVVNAAPGNFLSYEVRASVPVGTGDTSEESALGGVRLSRAFGKASVYGDFLYGRAQMNYANGGHQKPGSAIWYTQSRSTLYDAGVGAQFDITATFGVRFDYQFERFSTPLSSSGHGLAEPMTMGIVYHLPYEKSGHPY